jgi:glyoxylase-like metal-dependent hydrolase (beta-lactamase superfamily II)
MSLQRDVAPGIHRVEDCHTNWYLVEEEGRLTIVDAGVPSSWESLQSALAALGRRPQDIEALVLTHAHFDHVGFAERARTTLGIPVHVHETDVPLTRHPWRYDHERLRTPYFLTQVRALPNVACFLRNRAFWPSPIGEVRRYREGDVLDVPGRPRVIFTPGHTHGHCSLHLPERDAVILGDALVTLDPYTGRVGPRIVARAATVDSQRNLGSLTAIAELGAGTLLPGHGEPWRGEFAEAVALARDAGVA